MENKLVTVEKITEILPIKDADKIENIKLGDWSVVSQKGNYKVGDLVIMIRPDSLLSKELAEKYDVVSYLKNGNRVRVVRLKGCYSECLLLPISELKGTMYNIGDEVSNMLGITKCEELVIEKSLPKLPRVYFVWSKILQFNMWKSYFNYLYHKATRQKSVHYSNPRFSKYQKFENKKNVPNLFQELDEVIITEKLHGINARFGVVKKERLSLWDRIKYELGFAVDTHEFVYGSHNVQLGNGKKGWYSDDYYAEAAKKYDLEKILWNYHKQTGSEIVVYGEIYGVGIQKGYSYGLAERKLAVFDIVEDGQYLNNIMFDIRFQQLNITFDVENIKQLECAPVLYKGRYTAEVLKSCTEGKSILDKDTIKEGCVVKSLDRKKVFKSISNDYKIKQDRESLTDFH